VRCGRRRTAKPIRPLGRSKKLVNPASRPRNVFLAGAWWRRGRKRAIEPRERLILPISFPARRRRRRRDSECGEFINNINLTLRNNIRLRSVSMSAATCTMCRPSILGRAARGSVALRKFACGRGSGLVIRTRRMARAPPSLLRLSAQVAILGRIRRMPVRDRRMAFWERPTPALADRRLLGRRL
jgi:hypothetical protein